MDVFEKKMEFLEMMGFLIDKNEARGCVHYIKQILVKNMGFYSVYGLLCGLPMYMYEHSDSLSDLCESVANGLTTFITFTNFLTLLKNDELIELVQLLRNVDELYEPTNEHTKAIYEKTKKWCWFWSVAFFRALSVLFLFLTTVIVLDTIKKRDIEHRLKFLYPFDLTLPGAFELAIFTFVCNFIYAAYITAICNLMILCMFLNIVGQMKILKYKMGTLRSSAEAEVRKQSARAEEEHATSMGETESLSYEISLGMELDGSSERLRQSSSTQKQISCNDDTFSLTNLAAETGLLAAKDGQNVTASDERFDSLEEIEIRIKMQDLLKECIAHHCDIIKCIRAFEEYWNPFLSIDLTVCLAQSVVILISATKSDDNTRMVIQLIFTGFSYFMLGIFCYLSQQVTLKSELLQESIYGCGWIESSKSFRISIGILVSVTNQPIVIKARGFVPLSLDTFSRVLKTAYSYYMVLRSF